MTGILRSRANPTETIAVSDDMLLSVFGHGEKFYRNNKNLAIYRILGVALDCDNQSVDPGQRIVIYTNATGILFTRPEAEFNRKFTALTADEITNYYRSLA